ncbi:MAG: isopentenyl-diphosphate delta-isomerase, partial [Sphingobacteriales bacterium]
YEYDHVFIGNGEDDVELNPDEVAEIRYLSIDAIRKELKETPENYTEWFKIAFDQVTSSKSA